VAPANHRKATTVAKEVMAIKYGNKTGHSITKFLESLFAGKHPKLISKGTKAAAAEAAVTAAEAIAVKNLEETKRLAAEFEAMGMAPSPWRSLEDEPGPLARVLARTRVAPRVGSPLDRPRGNLDGPHGRCRRGG
jgi:tyrosyl-tRNA synthetase